MKRILSFILALCMILAFVPAQVRAEDEMPGQDDFPSEPEEIVEDAPEDRFEEEPEPSEPEIGEEPVSPDALPVTDGAQSVVAEGACGDDLTWTLDSSGLLTIRGTGAMENYDTDTMPWYEYRNSIRTLVIESGVTRIGTYAFFGCDFLQEAVIPEGVGTIGVGAFWDCCNLFSAPIPETVTVIGSMAFAYTALTSVTIPQDTVLIGEKAFIGCTDLQEIHVAPQNTVYCSVDGVLFDLAMTTLIQYPASRQATDYEIPQGVVTIEQFAFFGAQGLMSVVLPDGLLEIGPAAFDSCSGLCEIEIPDSVTSIRTGAFENCAGLWSVTVPQSVVNLEGYVFYSCEGLRDAVILADGNVIPEGMFQNCGLLESVTIPGSVTGIERRAFDGCTSLTDVWYGGSEEQWNDLTVGENNDPLLAASVHFRFNVAGGVCGDELTWTLDKFGTLTIGGTGDMWDYSHSSLAPWHFSNIDQTVHAIVIEPGVTGIGEDAFYQCGAESVTLPDGLLRIGRSAFSVCSVTSVAIPAGIAEIGDSAFFLCESLTGITIPEGVTRIPNGMLASCSALTSVTIPSTVTTIGTGAFSGCSSLQEIVIPASVTELEAVGYEQFSGCTALSRIDVEPENPTYCSVDGVLFTKDMSRLVRYPAGKADAAWPIPEGVTDVDIGAFSDCVNLTDVTIPQSMTEIGNSVFARCSSLQNITIPEGVVTIGERAFMYCSNLTTVSIPSSLTRVKVDAFHDCTSLTAVSITDLGAWCAIVFDKNAYFPYDLFCSNPLCYAHDLYLNGELVTAPVIPSGTFRIKRASFYGCSCLSGVTIPESVEYIDEYAFYGCDSLTDVFYDGTQAQWDAISISNDNTALTSAALHVTEPVIVPPTYVEQPQSVEVTEGGTATFTVVAEGTDLQYQWYRKPASSTWSKLSGETEPTLTVTASAKQNGYQYRCRITNSVGSVYSAIATLTVLSGKPVITLQPADVTVAEGKTATFRVAATGSNLTYQWYSKMGTGAWSTVSGQTSAALTVTAEMKNSGRLYRCRVKNEAGSLYSASATLTVTASKPKITEHPQPVTVYEGKTATFHVAASGSGLRYQWYSKLGNGAWSAMSGKTTDTLTVTAAAKNDGRLYRCKVSNSAGGVYSGAAAMTVIGKPVITQKPADVTVVEGQTAEFTVAATGENLRYQWYTKIGSGAWSAMTGQTSDTLTVTALLKNNGRLYRCRVINDAGGVYSGYAALTVLTIQDDDDEPGFGKLYGVPEEPQGGIFEAVF